jgi:hypothetical protein
MSIKAAKVVFTEEIVSGFSDYWKNTKLPWQLDDLTQDQIDAVRHVAKLAYLAAKREAKNKRL